jgi:hypothetical protein
MMDAIHQRRREVHDTLLPVLVEKYGDSVNVVKSPDVDTGAVVYGLPTGEVFCGVEASGGRGRACVAGALLRWIPARLALVAV